MNDHAVISSVCFGSEDPLVRGGGAIVSEVHIARCNMEVHLVPHGEGCYNGKKENKGKNQINKGVIYSQLAGSMWINHAIAAEYKVYIHPATGTIASEWSVLFTWKPRIYFEVETIA